MARSPEPTTLTTPTFADHVAAADRGSWWENVGVPILVSLAALFLVAGIAGLACDLIFGTVDDDALVTPASTVAMILSVVVTLWLMSKASKVSLADLGWSRRRWAADWVKGALGGLVAISVVWVANWALGGVAFSERWTDATAAALALAVVFFVFQGPFEEIVFRCYLLPQFATRIGTVAAMVVTSLMFMAMHGANPNTSLMGFVNLFIFGMAFAAVYVRTGSAWIVGAGHTTWNFFLGDFYGSNVSGNPMLLSVFRSSPVSGQELLSGGVYGMEGSIVATVIGIAIIVWALRGRRSGRSVPSRAAGAR